MKIWYCKIGETEPYNVPDGGDAPMRDAIELAYRRTIGEDPEFIFSGWGVELTEPERAVVEDRLPDRSKVTREIPYDEVTEAERLRAEVERLREEHKLLERDYKTAAEERTRLREWIDTVGRTCPSSKTVDDALGLPRPWEALGPPTMPTHDHSDGA